MTTIIQWTSFIGILTLVFVQQVVVNSEKSYHIQLDRFDPYTNSEKEFWDPGTLRITRKARNQFVLSGEFSLFKNFGDDTTIKYTLNRKNTNGKYSQLMTGSNTVCAQIVGDTKYYPLLAAASNIPNPAVCPFPKGTYKISSFVVGDEFLPQVLMPGEYNMDVNFIIDEADLFGYKMYVTVLPG